MSYVFFLSGVCSATFFASSIFFLKFWRASRDRFFLLFSGACALIAVERVVSLFVMGTWDAIVTPNTEISAWIYVIRLMAFLLILLAIIEKNKKEKLA